MELVSGVVIFHEKQRVVRFLCYIFPYGSEVTPNSFSSMDGLRWVLFVTLNQLITSCENF